MYCIPDEFYFSIKFHEYAQHAHPINPLTAGAAYIRVFIFY